MSAAISAEAYQHQISGGLTRIQSHLRELKGVVGTRDKKLNDSFENMRSEMDSLWKAVKTSKIKPQAVPVPSIAPQDLNMIRHHSFRDARF